MFSLFLKEQWFKLSLLGIFLLVVLLGAYYLFIFKPRIDSQNFSLQKNESVATSSAPVVSESPQIKASSVVKTNESAQVSTETSSSKLLSQVMPRIIRVQCMGNNGRSSGSGTAQLIDSQDPIIITNFHVVAVGELSGVSCQINLPQAPNYSSATGKALLARVGKFDTHYSDEGLDSIDVAVLHVQDVTYEDRSLFFSKFPLSFCQSSQIQIGSKVTVFGYPAFGGESLTVTDGIISGVLQTKWGPIYKTSAKFDGGVSGGLAVSNEGKCVVGIPTWKISKSFGGIELGESLGLIQPWETIKNSGDIF